MENSEVRLASQSPEIPKSSKVSLSFDLKWAVVGLLLVIVGMLALWRPWSPKLSSQSRTISVTGDAEVKAEPDEFLFSPTYEFKNADKTVALNELTAKQDEVVTGLKKLGVTDRHIKANSSGYKYDYYYDDSAKTYTYTLSLAITLNDKALTQKVQDYLVGTSPTGSVSPFAQFSTAKQKQVEAEGRDAATKDARKKANQSAANLGFKIGAVKTVTDDNGDSGGGCSRGLCSAVSMATDAASSDKSLAVQSGEDSLSYSVTVVYYVK